MITESLHKTLQDTSVFVLRQASCSPPARPLERSRPANLQPQRVDAFLYDPEAAEWSLFAADCVLKLAKHHETRQWIFKLFCSKKIVLFV